MKTILTALVLFICFGVVLAATPATRYSTADVERIISSGRIGSEYADLARKMQPLHVREAIRETIPYQLFYFFDYTLLIEAEEKFAIVPGGLCYNFALVKEKDRVILHYRYQSGSGIKVEHQTEYVVGSRTISNAQKRDGPMTEEPYIAPEPTSGSVTPRATEGVSK